MSKTILLIFGPQGSGKGTQAEMLAKKLELPAISLGELLRHEVDSGSDIGRQAETYMDKGELVPDGLTESLVRGRLHKEDALAGFILDGYPRNKYQQDELIKLLNESTGDDDKIYAIEVWISSEEAISRIGGRRTCDCGAVYHIKYNPPEKDEICDLCGRKLYIRDDDQSAAINKRLQLYHCETEPLLSYWRRRGKLIKINGEQEINKVHNDIMGKLEKRGVIKS
jgi:adenylate kinase